MDMVEKIKQDRNQVQKLRLKYRRKGDKQMAGHFVGQEIALNRVIADHGARITQLEQVFEKIDNWLESYKRDKNPLPDYDPKVWKAVRKQAIVILKDLRRIKG